MGSGTSVSCRRHIPWQCSANQSYKSHSDPLALVDTHGAKQRCSSNTAALSSAVASPGSSSTDNSHTQRTVVVPLAPEVLGYANPILAAAPLCGGRLKLSTTCRDADRAARHLAAGLVKLWTTSGGFDLNLACAKGDVESVWAFVVSGALHCSAAGPSTLHCSPVLYALAGQHKMLARLLRSKGWEYCPAARHEVLARDALHAASTGDLETVLLTLASGQQVNAGYTFGWTLLMSAAGGNQLRVVEVLLALGAKPSAVDSAGKRALDVAHQKGHVEVVRVLKGCTRNQ